MGAWKPGLPWLDSTVLETVIDRAVGAGCRVIVVGGYRYRLSSQLLSGREDVSLVRARRWRKGMDESIRRGIREVRSSLFFVTAADMPFIRSADYRRLAEKARARNSDATRPIRNGVPGHPVLFNRDAVPRLLQARPGTPFRTLLKDLNVHSCEWDHDGVIADIDTPEKYLNGRALAEGPLDLEPNGPV